MMGSSILQKLKEWQRLYELLERYHAYDLYSVYEVKRYKVELIDKNRKLKEDEIELYHNLKTLGNQLEYWKDQQEREDDLERAKNGEFDD